MFKFSFWVNPRSAGVPVDDRWTSGGHPVDRPVDTSGRAGPGGANKRHGIHDGLDLLFLLYTMECAETGKKVKGGAGDTPWGISMTQNEPPPGIEPEVLTVQGTRNEERKQWELPPIPINKVDGEEMKVKVAPLGDGLFSVSIWRWPCDEQ